MKKQIILMLCIAAVMMLAACSNNTQAARTPGGSGPGPTEYDDRGTAISSGGNPTGLNSSTRSPAQTPTPMPSPTPWPTFTPTLGPTPTVVPQINLIIQSCDTGFDLFNGMGEVTNAYVTVQNVGGMDANQVDVRLKANDEERVHPDKSYRVQHLPIGYEISLKLTVDTKSGVDTSIQVMVTSAEGGTVITSKASCQSRRPDQDLISKLGELFTLKPIQGLTPTP